MLTAVGRRPKEREPAKNKVAHALEDAADTTEAGVASAVADHSEAVEEKDSSLRGNRAEMAPSLKFPMEVLVPVVVLRLPNSSKPEETLHPYSTDSGLSRIDNVLYFHRKLIITGQAYLALMEWHLYTNINTHIHLTTTNSSSSLFCIMTSFKQYPLIIVATPPQPPQVHQQEHHQLPQAIKIPHLCHHLGEHFCVYLIRFTIIQQAAVSFPLSVFSYSHE